MPSPLARVRARTVALAGVLAFSLAVLACAKEPRKEERPGAAASPARAAAAPPAASGAPGAGDKTGSSLANARALTQGSPVTFELPCDAPVVLGPFRFTRDPEKLAVHARARSLQGEQICVGGSWVKATGAPAGGAGVGCPEGPHEAIQDVEYEYSPGNGGNDGNPVFLRFAHEPPRPKGCATVSLTLAL